MKIVSVGGGPVGLYFAILMKQLDPGCQIQILERNQADDTFGWGVVFSDETLGNFAEADRASHDAIVAEFANWSAIDIRVGGECVRSTGHGFSAISRRRLLNILQQRCEALGVRIRYQVEVEDVAALQREADLVLGADGVNSRVRDTWAASFQPSLDWGRCRFTWLGTDLRFAAFTFIFRENAHGLFQVHAYPFDDRTSTFIVECHEEVWRRAGLDQVDEEGTVAYLGELFRDDLQGHALLTNRSLWRAFPTVRNASWRHENVVLLGDAAHTAHFSIGSGTKLAMEDAIALADCFRRQGGADVPRALAEYEQERYAPVARTQRAAQTSLEWFENSARYLRQPPLQFAFNLLTRSKRITWSNLAQRDPQLVEGVARWFAGANPHREQRVERPAYARDVDACESTPPPVVTPLFQPFRLRELTLANRVVVSSMCQYSSQDGAPDDWHLVHLGSRAIGGAGLVMTEATHVSPEGRISPGCAGMYREQHVAGWRRVVDFVHRHSTARIGMQLAHAGRKGSCSLPWEGDAPLSEGWPLLSASPIAYAEGWPVPREASREDLDAVLADFVRAARMADAAGFDLLELHLAHGYLLGTFISPLTNRRQDAYGGDIAARARYPLEVFDAVRAAWPAHKPLSARISATDWKPGGLDEADRVALARLLKQHDCDIVDVSGGQTVPDQQPVYGRMFQVPFSDQIRHEVGIPTMSVGNIQDADQVQTILAAGRADLCVLARRHLADPYFTLAAAERFSHSSQYWPPQYLAAKPRH